MPITRLLSDSKLEPEQRHVLELAFKHTLQKLSLVDRNDPVCEIVAQRLINVHKRGVTNPIALAEMTIREIGLSNQ